MPLDPADIPGWYAAGCPHDFIETEYDVGMRIWRDRPDIIVMGHWYFSLPGAYPVPYLNPWLASEWDRGATFMDYELGEVPSTRRHLVRPLNPRLTGLRPLGDAAAWMNGSLYTGRPYFRLDQDGIPYEFIGGNPASSPFRFIGGGKIGFAEAGAFLFGGQGQRVYVASGRFNFGGGGVYVPPGLGAFQLGGKGLLVDVGGGAFKFGGKGLPIGIGGGAFAFGGGGAEIEEGGAAFRFGVDGGQLVQVGSGAFKFTGPGEEIEEGNGAFAFGGTGLLVDVGSGAFKFGGTGAEIEEGSAGFVFGGGGQVISGESISAAGVFFFSGAGSNVRFTVAFGTGKYDFDRNEVSAGGTNGVCMSTSVSNGGSASIVDSVTGMYFALKMLTGGVSSSGAASVQMFAGGATALFSLQVNTSNEVEMRIEIPTLSTSGQRFTVRVGFMDNPASPTEGVWLECVDNVNSGKWVMNTKKTSGGAGNTASNSTVAPVAGTITVIKVKVTGSSAEFFADGVSLGTIASNVPTAATGIAASITKSVGTSSLELDVDYIAPTVTF